MSVYQKETEQKETRQKETGEKVLLPWQIVLQKLNSCFWEHIYQNVKTLYFKLLNNEELIID